jgi:hypothetical protein
MRAFIISIFFLLVASPKLRAAGQDIDNQKIKKCVNDLKSIAPDLFAEVHATANGRVVLTPGNHLIVLDRNGSGTSVLSNGSCVSNRAEDATGTLAHNYLANNFEKIKKKIPASCVDSPHKVLADLATDPVSSHTTTTPNSTQ